ncbi:Mitochondrial carrier protein [Popillia japonica]|uniref:Mitochondrial carrier protein n=1 Tax=Popillia japonica TaxID=7064 RepID=A0AAW1ML37_POPJA
MPKSTYSEPIAFTHRKPENKIKMPKSTYSEPIAFTHRKPVIYAIGVSSAITAEVICAPFDLAKTRLQIQGEVANKLDYKLVTAPKRGMLKTVYGIATEEGIYKLYQGFSAIICRHSIYTGSRVTLYRTFKEDVLNYSRMEKVPIYVGLGCALVAGATGQFLATPADMCRVRIQMEGKRKLLGLEPRVTSLRSAFKSAWAQGGITGLYKGATPAIVRGALVTSGDIGAYDFIKKFILNRWNVSDSTGLHVVSSLCSGLIAAVIGAPADVVMTRTFNQRYTETGQSLVYSGAWDTVTKSVKNEGFFSLYKGFVPLYVKCGPWALLFWVAYEKIERGLGGTGW